MTQIFLMILQDQWIPISVAITFFCIISLLGIYVINRRFSRVARHHAVDMIASLKEVDSFAGDNIIATQLDLARALIETNRRSEAKAILFSVLQNGDSAHQKEAQALIRVM